MFILMYIVSLVIIIFSCFGGYNEGIFESSFIFFRSAFAFIISFTLAVPLTNLIVAHVEIFEQYPVPGYLQAVFFAAFFVILIGVSDNLRFKYLFSSIDITVNKYADKIAGTGIGFLNGIVLSGFVMILWAMLPFVSFLPGDMGRVKTENFLIDSGAILLRSYAHLSHRMGGSEFPLQDTEIEVEDEDKVRKSWMFYYRNHADFKLKTFDALAQEMLQNEED